MGQVLHGSATTTHAIRAAIQRSKAPLQELAARYGLNRKTVAKWRKRSFLHDAPMGPKAPRSTVLTAEEEATAVALRKHTLLPLDDCLYALQATIPHLTRSALHRCFQRHGISRLPEVEGERAARKPFRRYPIGYFHIDIAEVRTEEGKLHLFVAVDRTSKYVFARLVRRATGMAARAFLDELVQAVPYQIHTVLTDNGIQFADLPRNRDGPTARWRGHPFDRACHEHGIEHRLTKPNHPWTNGQVERMNRTLKEATVRRYHYQTHRQLEDHLAAFLDAYNFAKRLKTLRGLTPYEAICKAWADEPTRFSQDPVHLTSGLDSFGRLVKLRFPDTNPAVSTSSTSDYETYGYDANDNRISLRKRSGEVIAFTFDKLNRITAKDIPGGTAADVFTHYDLIGRRLYARYATHPANRWTDWCNVANVAGADVNSCYDKAGRLTQEAAASRVMAYQYDKAGNRTRATWPGTPSFYAGYVYDALNRVTAVNENGATTAPSLLATYAYDNLGRRVLITRGNATTTSYGYDNADRLTSLTQNLAATVSDLTLGWSYSPASQVLSRSVSNSTYDWTPPSTNDNYTYDGLNRDAAIAAVTGGYDSRGNLTFDGTLTYAYDLENRLLSVSGSPATTLAYDPLGRLQTLTEDATATGLLYDGDRLSAEYSGSTLLRRYVHGTGVDEPLVWYEGSGTADRRWLHADNQGSVVAWSNGAGASGGTYAYGPYGEPQGWTGSRFRYTGQIMLSAAQLYHYKARAYDPMRGWFLQTDPVGNAGGDLNLYGYVRGDPVNNADPTGMIIETGWDIFSAGLGWSDTINKARAGDGWGAVGAGLGAAVDTAAVFLPGVPGGVSAVRHGAEAAAGAVTKAERMAANAAQGARGEAATAAKLGDKTAGRQVTFKTSDGTRTRADFVTKDKGVVEAKTGGAQLSKGQQKLFDDVSAGRPVTPVGQNARDAGLRPGEPTRMKSCQIDRPSC